MAGRCTCVAAHISAVQSRGRPLPIQHGADRHHLRGADRLEGELLLAPPLDTDAMIRDFLRDQRGIQRHIVGAVMAVAAGALDMPHADRLRSAAQHVGQRDAQRIHGLRMGPDRQVPVAAFGQCAGRRDRGVRDIAAGIASPRTPPRRRPPADRHAADRRVGWPTSQAASCCAGSRRRALVPCRVQRRRDGGALRGGFIRAHQRDEIAEPHDPQFPARRPSHRRFIEARQAAPRVMAGAAPARAACPAAPCRE